MATFGRIEAYDATADHWTHYIERLEFFFVANDITTDDKKKAVMLSVCGAETYKLFRSLSAPDKPSDKSYTDLKTVIQAHLSPTPNIIAERFALNTRSRQSSESVSQYVAELKRLSQDCQYGASLNDMLRDRLVCGINDSSIQRKLLSEGSTLSFDNAFKIALSIESATQQSAAMHPQQQFTGNRSHESILKVSDTSRVPPFKGQESNCFRCGSKHNPATCPFKDQNCFFCNSKGHTARVCRKKAKSNKSNVHNQHQVGDEKYPSPVTLGTNVGHDQIHESPYLGGENDNLYNIYRCEIQREQPIFVTVNLDSIPTKMEIDTGASLTVMGEAMFSHLFPRKASSLEATDIKLRTYTGEFIIPKGVKEVNIGYENQSTSLPIIVTPGSGPALFGRNWLKKIHLNWANLFSMSQVSETNTDVSNLLNKFTNVFSEGIGTMADIEVHIELKDDAMPKYYKARAVPYALKQKIDSELDRLVKEGIYEPVAYSAWAAPIVPVVKDDGTVRICGDYKVTINPAAKCDNYPVPKTEDLLATLNGGQKFSKLDLSQAYQQLLLDQESQECLTVNTHRGLYKPTRLQYGVHSAAGIFQREMEKRLSHVPYTIVRVDDILVSGVDDNDHMKNLTNVFQILADNGLKLKRKKCSFMLPKVIYCGFQVSKEGVAAVDEKIQPILKAPIPGNATQLKSFLGMINYYHRHLPNLAHLLEPLHELLRKNHTWKWETKQDQAFRQAKSLLTSSALLVHYDPNKPLLLSCDASPYGLGAVLAHTMEDGTERPIAYISRTLSNAERNYAQIEKEGLAIVYAVKKLHQYLYGREFTIVSDHKPLLGLLGESSPIPCMTAARIQRWALLLSSYNYKLRFRAGTANANADGMSRLPVRAIEEEVSEVSNAIMMVNLSRAPVNSHEIRIHTRRDPTLSRILEFVLNGWPDSLEASTEIQPYATRANELAAEHGCLLWGSRVIVPPNLREIVLDELHQTHAGMSRMKSLARCYCWWPLMDTEIENRVKSCVDCMNHQQNPALATLHPWEDKREFKEGDNIIARNYSGGQKWLRGIVSEKTGPVSYKVKIDGGIIRRHVDQIRSDANTGENTIANPHQSPCVPPDVSLVEPQTSTNSYTEQSTSQHEPQMPSTKNVQVKHKIDIPHISTPSSTSKTPNQSSLTIDIPESTPQAVQGNTLTRPIRAKSTPKYLNNYCV